MFAIAIRVKRKDTNLIVTCKDFGCRECELYHYKQAFIANGAIKGIRIKSNDDEMNDAWTCNMHRCTSLRRKSCHLKHKGKGTTESFLERVCSIGPVIEVWTRPSSAKDPHLHAAVSGNSISPIIEPV